MNPDDRASKIEAIQTLLEFSLLFSLEEKQKIRSNLDSATDEQLESFGKVLACEHEHRDELDKKLEETDSASPSPQSPPSP